MIISYFESDSCGYDKGPSSLGVVRMQHLSQLGCGFSLTILVFPGHGALGGCVRSTVLTVSRQRITPLALAGHLNLEPRPYFLQAFAA